VTVATTVRGALRRVFSVSSALGGLECATVRPVRIVRVGPRHRTPPSTVGAASCSGRLPLPRYRHQVSRCRVSFARRPVVVPSSRCGSRSLARSWIALSSERTARTSVPRECARRGSGTRRSIWRAHPRRSALLPEPRRSGPAAAGPTDHRADHQGYNDGHQHNGGLAAGHCRSRARRSIPIARSPESRPPRRPWAWRSTPPAA
jgi:hypothetical protein